MDTQNRELIRELVSLAYEGKAIRIKKKTIEQVTDPSAHPKIQGFIALTQKLLDTFDDEGLWSRLEVFAEQSGIPLPVLTEAVLDSPEGKDINRIDWYAEHPG